MTEQTFQDLLTDSIVNLATKPGSLIDATILSIHKDHFVLDANLKSESFVPAAQFKYEDSEIKVGDTIKVCLLALDNGNGDTILSRDKARHIEVLQQLEDAYNNHKTINGMIVKKVRGGYTVMIKGVRAFLPGSLVGSRYLGDIEDDYEQKSLDLKVVRLDIKRNNVVVSRQAVIEEINSEQRASLLERIKPGEVLPGIVKNITHFGAFIDLGGIDGLLHIADISWDRIKHPGDVLSLGQKIEVKVLQCQDGKTSLGLKQLKMDPWSNIKQEIALYSKFKGVVTNVTDYGCFVMIKQGIEGLVHSSAIDWAHRNVNPHKYVSVGSEIEVMVIDIDTEKHRIALSIKDCKPNPWQEFAEQHAKGDIIKGKIISITDFGVFISLGPNLDGLIHVSDIAWQDVESEMSKFQKGDEIEAKILAIDVDRQRITLGRKQIHVDPFIKFTAAISIGSKVEGTVTTIHHNGNLMVEITPMVSAFIKEEDLLPHKENRAWAIGDLIQAGVMHIDQKNKVLQLSMRMHEQAANKHKYQKQILSETTIGGLIKDKLKQKNK